MLGMKRQATDGIDGRLAEDDGGLRGGRKVEEAVVFAGTRRHAAPGDWRGPTQFGPDGPALRVAQQENGVGSRVGVETAGLDEGSDEPVGEAALSDQVLHDPIELGSIGGGAQKGGLGRRLGEGRGSPT